MHAKFDLTGRQRIAATVLGTLVSLAVIAVVITPAASSHKAVFTCEESMDSTQVTGSGPGDTSSGPAAILGLNFSYYVDRSPEQTLHYLVPDEVTTHDRLEAGLRGVPADTRHCVRISPHGGDGSQWAVEVTEYQPSADPSLREFAQTITTRTHGGQTLISEITPA